MLNHSLLTTVITIAATLVTGCATNSAITLMNASRHTDLIAPDSSVIEQKFKGQAFQLGKVYFDPLAVLQVPEHQPAEFFRRVMQRQVQKGFTNAALERGNIPANVVDIAIVEMKFTRGKLLIPDPSIFRVRIEVHNERDGLLMKGELESRYLSAVTIILPGVVGALPTAFEGQEWTAVVKMIPAVGIAITRTVAGLQEGKNLGEIVIYPESVAAGGLIVPDLFLRGSPYGISELTRIDFHEASEDK